MTSSAGDASGSGAGPVGASPLSRRHSVDLYPWQQAALEAWRAADRRGVVQAVTGAGKTRVGVGAIAEALAAGRRSVVIVPSRVLVEQWLSTLRELLPRVKAVAGIRPDAQWQVCVTTVQAAMNRPVLKRGEQGLLVADECHRYGAEQFSRALRPHYEWRLGLTATLERGDSGDKVLASYFGSTVYEVGYGEALAGELIAPFRFAHVSVPLTPEERAQYDELSEGLRKDRDTLVVRYGIPLDPIGEFLQAVSTMADDRTASSGGGLARRYLARFARRKKLLAETRVKQFALAALAPAVRASAGTIVFTQTQESSERSAEMLQQMGYTAAAVHAGLDQDEREERIDFFRDRTVSALTAPRILDEGVDVPEADLGIILASNRSRRQLVQRLGRVLRKRPGKVARFVVLYAAKTVEDPFAGAYVPDFYDLCLPYAQEVRRFDLARPELDDLLAFLGEHADPGAGTTLAGHLGTLPAQAAGRDQPSNPASDETHDSRGGDSPTSVVAGSSEARDAPGGATDCGQEITEEGELEPILTTATLPDLTKLYLQEAGRMPLLTSAQEQELAKTIEAGLYAEYLLHLGDEHFPSAELKNLVRLGAAAKERIISANLRLVVKLAKRYAGRGVEFLDLVQDGNIGLMHAVDKFDYTLGGKFSTYATWWIKQAIARGMADTGRAIRLPVHVGDLMRKVDRARKSAQLTWRQLLKAHPHGIAELDVDRPTLEQLARFSQAIVSVEDIQDFDDSMLTELSADAPESTVEAVVDRLALQQRYTEVMDWVEFEDPRGAFVLRARYGVLTSEPETLEVIGARLGVTRERARQLEKAALELAREISVEMAGIPVVKPRRAAGIVSARAPEAVPRRAIG
ncbi:sigma-70 family RNA polymerase sigma factor [Granulicoccus phenolivorans]|uniref:sigma-70 family RNA polymerase sigma factor n=1 Tax=Granulicoccus phenolivorans TaxID=266854 RepID=UPI0009DBB762|nr:sigma-70 family RNA polymerase sigma factor [Granulicoccus phenolivorans]